MNLIIETEQEKDGRWIAGTAELPGALAYGTSRQEAITKVEALALRILADRLEHGETPFLGKDLGGSEYLSTLHNPAYMSS